jgi:hypothetical protein
MSHVNQLQQLQAGGQHLKPEPEKKITNWTLKLTLTRGKGFVEYLSKPNSDEKLAVSINFLNYRKRTKWVEASVEPFFNEVIFFSFS